MATQPITTVPTIRHTTQQHLDIEEIINDIVILKDGSGCLIVRANAINFSLLSEDEQEATMYAYAAILNSLTYPIQIIIQSERKDVSNYIRSIKLREDQQPNKLLREHIRRYRRFVEETVKKNNVLDKKFYIVIPFTSLELGSSKALFASVAGTKGLPFPLSYIIEKASQHLIPKRDHLTRQFSRLGIQLHQLTTPELIELFYRTYNPDVNQGIRLDTAQNYASPIVQGSPELVKKVYDFLSHTEDTTDSINNNPTSQPNNPPPTNTTPTIPTPPPFIPQNNNL